MIGSRIKELRKQKRLTITELAKRAGVSKSYLSYIERDVQKNPSLQFLTKISKPLDTSIEYLLGEEKTDTITNEILDKEWTKLLMKAIDDGLSKEDFREIQNFIKFRNWKNDHIKNEGGNNIDNVTKQ
ncbi:helix-turn-helix domain-containing protein [Fredinandcohnia sp. QZ13]|uniref:helix-turn-helix domain-containing protein n=1 Tax=Fredinandcohnia sp. QZ13 TaxID=3073144 RepID=UPI0028535939|nr:helix-turn-helix domain-containing protein [Fredinandcohnia sp. QZ13]MDR4888910.1 helix-turn-helix domain-containing protein [Fredinandcohnia sp. QZ13]